MNLAGLAVQVRELDTGCQGIQSVLMNEGARSKAGEDSHCWKTQGGRGLSSEWESVLPALEEDVENETSTGNCLCIFKSENGIYRSRL